MDLIIQTILNIGSDEFYRTHRYKVPLVVVLINSNDKNAFHILEKFTRQTDIVQQLSPELLVVYLSHTSEEDANLFINKFTDKFDFTYTLDQFINDEYEFIHQLLLQNSKKNEKLITTY